MQARALRPRNLNINYQIEPLNESSLSFHPRKSPKNLPASQATKSSLPPTSTPLQSPPSSQLPDKHPKNHSTIHRTSTQRQPATSIPLKAPQRPAKTKPRCITKNHSVASATTLQASLPSLPDFEPLKHTVPLHKAYNTLPLGLRGLDIKPGKIFDLFFDKKIIDIMVTNTNLYATKKMSEEHGTGGRNTKWKPVTYSELSIWLSITIHMGCLGLPPSHYWKADGRLLPRNGLPTTPFMGQTRFEQIRRYFHISNPELGSDNDSWHTKIDPLLDQLRYASQKYRVPSSNITVDEAMICFTGRSIHITKMPNKPIGEGYKFFALADKGYVWDFHPSSNACGLDPVDKASADLTEDFSNTTRMVHHLVRKLRLRHRTKAWNVYMDNYFTTVPLLAELRKMGVGGCGTAKSNLKGYPNEFKMVTKKSKLEYHFRSGVVKDGVDCLLWMDSAPVSMMSTIHSLKDQDLKTRWHPGDKSTNAAGADTMFQGETHMEMLIPIIILAYNIYKVGVDTADQYRTYYDSQLTSRHNWYPIFYWILETALINSLIIYQDLHTADIDHLDFRLDIAWALIERGCEVGAEERGGSARRDQGK